jgi:hypothetical protein
MVYVTTKNTLIVINQQLKIFIIKYSCMGKYVHLMEKSLKFVNLEKFLHGQ